MKKLLVALGVTLFSAVGYSADFEPAQGVVLLNTTSNETTSTLYGSIIFTNNSASKASLVPTVTGPFMVALNRCVSVSSGKSCSVTVSFSPKGKAGAVAPGTLYEGSISAPNATSSNIQARVIRAETTATPSNMEFSQPVYEANFSTSSQRSMIATLDVTNKGDLSAVPEFTINQNNSRLLVLLNRCVTKLAKNKTCSIIVSINQSVGAVVSNLVSIGSNGSVNDTAEIRSVSALSSSYNLTVNPPNFGSISGAVSGSVPRGTVVNLSLLAPQNAHLLSWSGPCSGTSLSCSFVMDSDKTVSATFECDSNYTLQGASCVINQHQLTVTQPSLGTLSGATSGLKDHNSSISLSYAPIENGTFTWQGACEGSTHSTCSFVMTSDQTVSLQLGCVSGFTLSGSVCQEAAPALKLAASGVGVVTGCVIRTGTGKAYCWGDQNSSTGYSLSSGSTATSNVDPIKVIDSGTLSGKMLTYASGGNNTLCVGDSTGKLYCAGNNSEYLLANSTTTVSTNNSMGPAITATFADKFVTRMETGARTHCASAYLLNDSTKKESIYCWGYNSTVGFTGTGIVGTSTSYVTTPTPIAGMSDKTVIQFDLGVNGGCVLAYTDSDPNKKPYPYCWGSSTASQLGSTTPSSSPISLNQGALVGKTVEQIRYGNQTICALAYNDGDPLKQKSVYCWGQNSLYQNNPGLPTSNVTTPTLVNYGVLAGKYFSHLAVGSVNTCVVSQGVLYCWGANVFGGLGTGATTASNVNNGVVIPQGFETRTTTSVEMYANSICALAYNNNDATKENKLYCWGTVSSGTNTLSPLEKTIPTN